MKKKPLTRIEEYHAKMRELGKKCIVCSEPMPNYKIMYCSDKCRAVDHKQMKYEKI
jgi:predicted nucleic acid-binding Zn ribbon protein